MSHPECNTRWHLYHDDMLVIATCDNKAAKHYNCVVEPDDCEACPLKAQLPSLTKQVANYVKSTVKWVKAKKPERTDEEVATIYNICLSCSSFLPKLQRCRHCGCRVNDKGGWFNKIRRLTEHCPRRKWQ